MSLEEVAKLAQTALDTADRADTASREAYELYGRMLSKISSVESSIQTGLANVDRRLSNIEKSLELRPAPYANGGDRRRSYDEEEAGTGKFGRRFYDPERTPGGGIHLDEAGAEMLKSLGERLHHLEHEKELADAKLQGALEEKKKVEFEKEGSDKKLDAWIKRSAVILSIAVTLAGLLGAGIKYLIDVNQSIPQLHEKRP